MHRRIGTDRCGLPGRRDIRLYDGAEDSSPRFDFDCRRPGLFRFRLIDHEQLLRYLDQGIEGDYQESAGHILWVEPIVLY